MPAPNEISPQQLLNLIGTPLCPVIVDMRTPDEFGTDPRLVPGAIRHCHTDMAGLIRRLKERASVIMCQQGLKLSQSVVSALQAEGLTCEYLSGGALAWAKSGAVMVPFEAVPFDADGQTCWITHTCPKIGRIACAWLIRRFIDPEARFLFVADSKVQAGAARFNATPFDTPGAEFTHQGDFCTFDSMLERFCLQSRALDCMAQAIRAAETNRSDLHPVAAGLMAVSDCLSRKFRNDHSQMEAGLALYDGLYRWARDGQGLGHAWPAVPARRS
ncbi:chromate resistance protein [Rhodobacteraceae bacterium KMM 6894]|nr:chromate resistance protein [Rhodobacteraceae bacterium KMM 6894]